MSRIDLRRAFKQLFRALSQMNLLATTVGDFVFIDATMSMGLRNTCKLFEENFMKAFVKGLIHHHPELFSDRFGALVNSYLDDIWFLADTAEKNTLQLLVAEFWARWLGIQLNEQKREVPCSTTRHLGFMIDLNLKVVRITAKYKGKIFVFFDRLMLSVRKKGRILIKDFQKLLGLQIWISSVFRVARQFLTSFCDILKAAHGRHTYFYPSKYPLLVTRAIRDLQFWRRLVSCSASMSFDYLLNRLPENNVILASDACTSFGMAGVLRFQHTNESYKGFDGLFWQMTWEEWQKIAAIDDLLPGNVKINVAEFLALLITIETFAEFCKSKVSTLEVDNITAKAWFDAARCPKFPFDRCAQGTHLFMMECAMKIVTPWISSSANVLADTPSRRRLSKRGAGCNVAGSQLLKVKPRWKNVIKFLQIVEKRR